MRLFLRLLIIALLLFNIYLALPLKQTCYNATELLNQQIRFSDLDKTALTMEQLFELEEDCLVYFYSDDCSSCLSSNEYMLSFIEAGFDSNLKIYFVDVSINTSLLADHEILTLSAEEFGVYYTPCALLFGNGEVTYYRGTEQIYRLLSQYIEQTASD